MELLRHIQVRTLWSAVPRPSDQQGAGGLEELLATGAMLLVRGPRGVVDERSDYTGRIDLDFGLEQAYRLRCRSRLVTTRCALSAPHPGPACHKHGGWGGGRIYLRHTGHSSCWWDSQLLRRFRHFALGRVSRARVCARTDPHPGFARRYTLLAL